MTYSFNPKYSLLLFSMALAAANATAGTESTFSRQISKDQIYSEMVAEVARDSQEFANYADSTQLRHRVNEGNGNSHSKQKQQGNMNKHQHRYQYKGETANRSQPRNGSGSMNRRSGGGGGGGGRR